jgi:hypothetical protein
MRRFVMLLTLLALGPVLATAQEPACTGAAPGAGTDDVIEGTPGADALDGGAGADRISGLAGDDCLMGSAGPDALQGGDGNDRLSGDQDGARDGDGDVLDGNAGADALDGGGGDDELTGGPGDDTLHGGFGDDAMRGDEGDDVLEGVTGLDSLVGGDGADRLQAEGGSIQAGAGPDQIRAQDATIEAGPDDDVVTLDLGHSVVDLGEGNDRGRLADGAPNKVQCGPGDDTVTVDRRDRVTGCEHVTRRAMPDPRMVRRSGGTRTTFTITFASPVDYDLADDEGGQSLAAEVVGPSERCTDLIYEIRRARRGGRRERIRMAAPAKRWCRGRYRVQIWLRTFQTSSSCDSGDELTDEDCRGTANLVGEARSFRVR